MRERDVGQLRSIVGVSAGARAFSRGSFARVMPRVRNRWSQKSRTSQFPRVTLQSLASVSRSLKTLLFEEGLIDATRPIGDSSIGGFVVEIFVTRV